MNIFVEIVGYIFFWSDTLITFRAQDLQGTKFFYLITVFSFYNYQTQEIVKYTATNDN